ncbi:Hypothetical protein AJAP_27900 [Amycolatopsis japonica]|uniref:Uncharacterized protein n=1 Tax=Amycolatopsis japonica TaxID=208439 RepID=A0A075V1F5_9PSEU|nr:hypothetical protein [Amycolatopsis japonica]AIG78424.1 Hypothetical protein AJAP_27900 [Amycolatopsis japonica]
MTNIEIFFKNDTSIEREDVVLEEGITALTVHTGPGEKSVIPLASILYYDVEDAV